MAGRRLRRSARGVGALLALATGGLLGAQAHAPTFPKRDQLHIDPGSVALTVEYEVAGDEAVQLARLFDRDRSGRLDAGECSALRDSLAQVAVAFARLDWDGQPLPLARRDAVLRCDGAGPLLLQATWVAPLPVRASPTEEEAGHRLRLTDRHKDRRVAVPLRITVDGVRIDDAGPAAGRSATPLRLLHEGVATVLRVRRGPASPRF